MMKVFKIIIPIIGVLYGFYVGFTEVGEIWIKTADALHYNWQAVPKRIIVSVVISLILGALGYGVGFGIQKLGERFLSYLR